MIITISGYADGESWEFQNVPYEVAEAVATIMRECRDVSAEWNGCDNETEEVITASRLEDGITEYVSGKRDSFIGITVPNNPTNGDVIRAVFPNVAIMHNLEFTLREMVFTDEWWNKPYGE